MTDTPVGLKKCPFCGGIAKLTRSGGSDERNGYCKAVSIKCETCAASVTRHDEPDENGWCIGKSQNTDTRAKRAWNTRHDGRQDR